MERNSMAPETYKGCRPKLDLGPITTAPALLCFGLCCEHQRNLKDNYCGVWIPSSHPQSVTVDAPWDDSRVKWQCLSIIKGEGNCI